MIKIDVEKFKRVYNLIAELVVTLDKDNKAILKPRNEIDMYLECQIPERQELIIGELNHVLFLNAISESYLLADRKEYGTKISFENYLTFKLRSATNHIEHNQFLQDDRIIKNLKEELKGFTGKDARINFLLEKKRELEGDYPEAFGEILTKNEIYLFLNRELDYWEKYREIGIITRSSKPKQLKTNLTETQRGLLFDLLAKGGFILDENKDCFIWAFGKPTEKQPEHFKPVKWDESKALLAYFVDIFNCTVLGNDGKEKRTQWKPFELIFDQSGLRGAKNDYQKTGTLPIGNKYIDKIINDILI